MISKFMDDWLPTTGSQRTLISKESYECPNCYKYERTEHLLTCKSKKIRNNRVTGMKYFFLSNGESQGRLKYNTQFCSLHQTTDPHSY